VTWAEPLTAVPTAVALTVVVPFPTAVATPELEQVATVALVEAQVNVVPLNTEPPEFRAVAENVVVPPSWVSEDVPGVTVTEATVLSGGLLPVGPGESDPQLQRPRHMMRAERRERILSGER